MNCDTYWGSHGCVLDRGHDGHHFCCCDCDNHPDPDSGCVGTFPYYGSDTKFYKLGEDHMNDSTRIRQVHLITGSPKAVDLANNMIALGWKILEIGMDPYGWPTFVMGWDHPLDNPPAAGGTE